jgi:hypothetical protein
MHHPPLVVRPYSREPLDFNGCIGLYAFPVAGRGWLRAGFHTMKTFSCLMPCLLLMGLGVWVCPAWAQPSVDDFERSVATVRQLLESQGYEEALERLGRLKPLARDANQKSIVALYEGLVLSSMGRQTQDRAQSAFRSALLQDPQASLPVKVVPRQERLFEEVRARVLKERAGRPALAREGTASPVAPSSEDGTAPVAELASVRSPAKLDTGDRLVEMFPALAASNTAGFAPVAVSFTHRVSRPRVLVPTLTGAALLASAGVFWGLAQHEQSQLRKVDLSHSSLEDARLMAVRGTRYQNWGLGLAGAGGVALGVATVFYVRQSPKAPVAMGVGVNGTSAFVKGTWP